MYASESEAGFKTIQQSRQLRQRMIHQNVRKSLFMIEMGLGTC